MILYWNIKLYQTENGRFGPWIVKITHGESTVEGRGRTPHLAYCAATDKLVVKPWLESHE